MAITSKLQFDNKDPFAKQGENNLPFPYLFLNWNNGDPRADKNKGAQHFGGWQCGEEDFDKAMGELQEGAPYGFVNDTWVNKEGKEYNAYSARHIFAAVIAARQIWKTKDDGSQYTDNDVLVMLGEKTKVGFAPLYPAVLHSKGWSGKYISDAFQEFAKSSVEIRRAEAPGIPYKYFYTPIGTFGDNRNAKQVGTGKTSPIVPAQVPSVAWDAKKIAEYFVGDETIAKMQDFEQQAKDWLAEAKKDKEPAATNAVSADANIDEINAALEANDHKDMQF